MIAVAGGKHLLGMSRGSRVAGTAKVGEKGQIVIPKEARDLLGIRPGDTLLVLADPENGLVVSKPEVLRDVAARIMGSFNRAEEGET